jgi:hypothetical protein
MRKSTALKAIALACICAFILVTPLAVADESTESFSVYTDKQEYSVGETVNLYVKANAIDPNQTITVTDVVVYDPANIPVAEWHGLSIVLTDTTTPAYVGAITAETEGTYTVSATATGCLWFLRGIWYFICLLLSHRPRPVIPEVPVGTVMAGVSMIAALFAFMAVPRLRRKQHRDT